jgi:tungstate transport system substrate-binding protein
VRFTLARFTLAVLLAVMSVVSCQSGTPRLVLVTTTSVGNAGLLDVLTPTYERRHGVRFGVHLVGSGRALAMLESRYADVVISHAPEAEAVALHDHPNWWYRKIMFNDFLVVGPPDDRAHARQASSLDEALRRIAGSAEGFVSRGDQSGTHERERALWGAVRVTPRRNLPTGQGMATTLRVTSERGAYTLTDRATWTQLAGSLRLVPVVEGDPRLLNTYAVIVGEGERHRDALAFARWLAVGPGRDVIASVPGFSVWPVGRANTRPEHRPD